MTACYKGFLPRHAFLDHLGQADAFPDHHCGVRVAKAWQTYRLPVDGGLYGE